MPFASQPCHKNNPSSSSLSSSLSSYFTGITIIAKQLNTKPTNNEKQKIVTWKNALLKQIKGYIDSILNSAEVNVIDPTKDNLTQQLSFKEILDELQISKEDYYRALSISKDEDLELHLKRQPNSLPYTQIWTYSYLAARYGHIV